MNLKCARYLFAVILVYISLQTAFGQPGKGSLLVAVRPENAIIRLDTTLLRQTQTHFVVDTGLHIIRVWAPGRVMLTDTLQVSEARPLLYRRKLQSTEAYKEYKNKLFAYKTTRFAYRQLPGLFTIGATAYFIIMKNKYDSDADEYLDKAKEYKTTYETSTDADDILLYKTLFNKNKEKYESSIDRSNKISTSATIIIPAGIVATGVCYYLSRKLTRPLFEETPLLSDLTLDYKLTGPVQGLRINYLVKF